jgi:hypothetical protein
MTITPRGPPSQGLLPESGFTVPRVLHMLYLAAVRVSATVWRRLLRADAMGPVSSLLPAAVLDSI